MQELSKRLEELNGEFLKAYEKLGIDEKNAKVSVRDSGDGIDPEQVPHLFTSFAQFGEKNRVGRLGLGLSIAKDIVLNHGGRIWAQSAGIGKGATFNFTLPVVNG